MISAELIHNPYLLETIARFNGHSPKVNSAIEKYDCLPLVEWVEAVPRIFHDEMNGFDFYFYFTGTESDYKRVVKAFQDYGAKTLDISQDEAEPTTARSVDEYDVQITHRATIEDVGTKRQEISDLLAWLGEHRNRWFDYDEFICTYAEALDGTVPYIVVKEDSLQLDLPSVSVEAVDSPQEDFPSMDLTNTPILLTVSPTSKKGFREELQYVLHRPEIEHKQLFFLIHPAMNKERVIRIISDLGVNSPQVVDRPDDQIILRYLEDYPATAYIRRSIRILRDHVDEIKGILEGVSVDSEVTSADTREEIAILDSEIEKLKDARRCILDTTVFSTRRRTSELCERFESQLLAWRNRKSGATGLEQIASAAQDYAAELQRNTRLFETDVTDLMHSAQLEMEGSLHRLYSKCEFAPSFYPNVTRPKNDGSIALPDIARTLSDTTGTTRVSTKNDFFGLFGSSGSSSEQDRYVEVASYDVWRYSARGAIMPLLDQYVKAGEIELSRYHEALVKAYVCQLDFLIREKGEDKELAASMLSEAEQILEEDKDWLSEFEEQLDVIERN